MILADVGNHRNTFPIIRKESTILMLTLFQISNAFQKALGNPSGLIIQIKKLMGKPLTLTWQIFTTFLVLMGVECILHSTL